MHIRLLSINRLAVVHQPQTFALGLLPTYNMKFLAPIVSALVFIGAVNAQASYIGYPADGTSVKRGEQIVVQVVRPNSIMGSIEVGLAIGLQSCADRPCAPANQAIGTVLYHGPYDPEFHEKPGMPYQNFTVTVPTADYFNGKAQLSVNRFHLIGAGPYPVLESNNITLNVVP
ncbi:hypothetical protein LshimejAT787_1001490 [Lyophyllum shimeji]|uniref:Uncharacterized protein n=1 Tax=Lyophyllum shimeji TaxID=47721 RepID=A0A9P3PU32_LYOSH|nr:hypothetical protein LshimejAT787_1001490 [Lyophyllum shimeji]